MHNRRISLATRILVALGVGRVATQDDIEEAEQEASNDDPGE